MSSQQQPLTKRRFIQATAATLVAANAGHAVSAERWQAYTYIPTPDSGSVRGFKKIIAGIEAATDHAVAIDLHLGGTLSIKEEDVGTAIRDGIIQLADDAEYQGAIPGSRVLRLPFLLQSNADFDKAAPVVLPYIREQHLKKLRAVVLAQYVYPINCLWSSKKLTSLKDLNGQKIRINTADQGEFVKRFGAIPVLLGTPEVASALSSHVVDGVITAASGAGFIWADLLKYVYEIGVNFVDSLVVVGNEALEDLPEQTHAGVRKAAVSQAPATTADLLAENDTITAKLKQRGLIFTPPSAEDIAEGVRVMQDYWLSWAKSQGPEVEGLLKKIRAAVGR